MADSWDAVVIGGGHSGLVAAGYLARAGARTLVCESRHKTGGAATTDAPWPEAPEIKVTRLSYVMSLMPPSIVRDLDLVRHGYTVHPMGPYYQAWPDGRSLRSTPTTRPATTTSWPGSPSATPTRCPAGTPGSAGSPTCSRRCSCRPRRGSARGACQTCATRSGWPGGTAGWTSGRSPM
jgi:phytoene dehydrogenase-like protein